PADGGPHVHQRAYRRFPPAPGLPQTGDRLTGRSGPAGAGTPQPLRTTCIEDAGAPGRRPHSETKFLFPRMPWRREAAMVFSNILWLIFLLSALQPLLMYQTLRARRVQAIRRLEKLRGSRVITLIHRQESF